MKAFRVNIYLNFEGDGNSSAEVQEFRIKTEGREIPLRFRKQSFQFMANGSAMIQLRYAMPQTSRMIGLDTKEAFRKARVTALQVLPIKMKKAEVTDVVVGFPYDGDEFSLMKSHC